MSSSRVIHQVTFLTFLVLSSLWSYALAADKGIIAYVSSSIDNKEIRLINPDGTQGKLLWKVPISAGSSDRIGSLSWHPDGTELAFDSGHNWQRTMAIRSIYSISSDGTNLRKITNPPGTEGSKNNPTGTVKFWVRGAGEQGDVQIYTEGAKEPHKYFAKLSYDYQITQTVTDWGAGVRQYIRLWDPGQTLISPCRFSQEGWVDIIPGQEVDLDNIPFKASYENECFRYHSPSWSQDGADLIYMLGWGFSSYEDNTRKISSHATTGGIGHGIINIGRVHHVTLAKTASRKNEALYSVNGSLYSDSIYLLNTESGAASEKIEGAIGADEVLGITWLPDASGFITSQIGTLSYSEEGSGHFGGLYLYKFADKSLIQLARLPKESIGKLAISPDGTSIVFERGQEFPFSSIYRETPCRPCSLWSVNIDGSNLHQLVEDGRAPAWGKKALTPNYLAGDANGDHTINIQDVVASINLILNNSSALKGADCNHDGSMNIQDVICTINKVLAN